MIPSILIAIIMFVVVSYFSWRDLRFGLYFLILTLPLNNRLLFELGVERLLPMRVVIYSLLLVCLGKLYDKARETNFFGSLKDKSKRKKLYGSFKRVVSREFSDPVFFCLCFLLLIRIISLINSLSLRNSLDLLLFYASMVFIYIVFKWLYEKYGAQFLFKIFALYLIVAVFSGFWSLLQLYYFETHGRVLPGVWPLPGRPTRYGSTFWDINHYAPYLVTIIPFLAAKGLYPETALKGILYWSGFFYTIAILVMTLSRSGWLGIFVALLVMIPLFLLKKHFKTTAAYLFVLQLLATGAFIGSIYLGIPILQRLKSLTGLEHSDSLVAHNLIIKGNFEIFTKHPVLGGGYGSFNEQFRQTSLARKYFIYDPVEDAHLPAHSLWLETLSETGIVGFAMYLFLFFLILKLSLNAVRSAKDINLLVINIALFSSLLGVLTAGIFYSYNLEYFWVFAFFVVFFARLSVKEEKIKVADLLISFFLLGLSAFFILNGLGKIKLIDWDESIYAEVSKNILKSRDLITLHWLKDKPWFEKPPLYMWLTAITYWAFGISEFTARLWSAISGIAGVIGVYIFGKKLFNRQTGLVAALVLISTVHWIFESRNGTLDVMVATLCTLALYFFYLARENVKSWFWVGVFLGLAFMTKGVVVVVALAAILLFALVESIVTSDYKKYLNKNILVSLFSFGLIVLPWHIASYLVHGRDFINLYFFYHIFERTKGIEGHGNEWYWYFIVMKHWFRHWSVVLIPALVYFFFKIWEEIKNKRGKECLSEIFLIIWAFITFVIFSLSVSKIQWYIIPIYPALALIVARFISRLTLEFSKVLTFIVFLTLFLSVPYSLNRYRKMWDIPDNNLGVALLASQMEILTPKNPDAVLFVYGLSPGPAMFYSDRVVLTTTESGLRKNIEGREPFFALALNEDFERLVEGKEDLVAIFAEREGFVLFGRTVLRKE